MLDGRIQILATLLALLTVGCLSSSLGWIVKIPNTWTNTSLFLQRNGKKWVYILLSRDIYFLHPVPEYEDSSDLQSWPSHDTLPFLPSSSRAHHPGDESSGTTPHTVPQRLNSVCSEHVGSLEVDLAEFSIYYSRAHSFGRTWSPPRLCHPRTRPLASAAPHPTMLRKPCLGDQTQLMLPLISLLMPLISSDVVYCPSWVEVVSKSQK